MALNALAIRQSLPDKETLARKWMALKSRFGNIQKAAAETTENVVVSGTTFGTFSLAFYLRQRRKLAGKRNTFDKKGKVDAFFWPGLAIAIAGATPLLGKAGRYAGAGGVGLMCAGSTDYLSEMAKEHHDKAKK